MGFVMLGVVALGLVALFAGNRASKQIPSEVGGSGVELESRAAWYKHMLWVRKGRLVLDETRLRFVLGNGMLKFDIPRSAIESVRYSPFGLSLPMKKSAELEVTAAGQRHRVFLISEGGMGLFGDAGRQALAPWKAALSPQTAETEASQSVEGRASASS